ncbi:MAG: lysophospholipid acyltransferase family protein [Lachnospiraceae bacterium]|nr:lysophospholipid acyltransferase family protein [Lachnospiraceae bacterium]
MFRGIFTMCMAGVYFVVSLPVELIYCIIRAFSRKKADRFIFNWIKAGFHMVNFFCGNKLTVIGLDRIPRDRPVVFIANHRSIFDVMTSYSVLPDPTGVLAKDSLGKIPLFGLMMKQIYCLFLDRSSLEDGLRVITQAIDYVKSGINYMVFPEGTRNKEEGTLLPFHAGSFKIATRTGAPIIPLTIVNTGDIFDSHIPEVHPAHVIIDFGEPIETKTIKASERKLLPEKVRDIIQETYQKDKKLI